MFVCHYCKTSFKKKTFFCRNCSRPILNELGRQLAGWQLDRPILTDIFENTKERIFYFVKEFKNFETEDENFYIQVNEIIKLLFIFCEKTKYDRVVLEMTIEGDGHFIEGIDFSFYAHEEDMERIEKRFKKVYNGI